MIRRLLLALAAGLVAFVLGSGVALACAPTPSHHAPKPYPTCSAIPGDRCTPGTSTARPPKPVSVSPSVGAPSKPCKTATTPVIVPTTPAPQTPTSTGVSSVTTSPAASSPSALRPPKGPTSSGPVPLVTPSSGVGPPLAMTGVFDAGKTTGIGLAITVGGVALMWLSMWLRNNRLDRRH